MKLQSTFQPKILQLKLVIPVKQLVAAEKELAQKASQDANRCYGYFPGMAAQPGIDVSLPDCKQLATLQPTLSVGGKTLGFNFIRLSQIQQTGTSPYHLDSDAKTALTGDTTTISERLVWRLLLNLSDQHPRKLSYLDADPFKLPLETGGGYIHCPNSAITKGMKQYAVIPPRSGQTVSGLLFCASRVLHTGQDDQFGHFVAGYGVEE